MPSHLPCLGAIVASKNLIVTTARNSADNNALIDALLGKLL